MLSFWWPTWSHRWVTGHHTCNWSHRWFTRHHTYNCKHVCSFCTQFLTQFTAPSWAFMSDPVLFFSCCRVVSQLCYIRSLGSVRDSYWPCLPATQTLHLIVYPSTAIKPSDWNCFQESEFFPTPDSSSNYPTTQRCLSRVIKEFSAVHSQSIQFTFGDVSINKHGHQMTVEVNEGSYRSAGHVTTIRAHQIIIKSLSTLSDITRNILSRQALVWRSSVYIFIWFMILI